jgi:hypothetical protein
MARSCVRHGLESEAHGDVTSVTLIILPPARSTRRKAAIGVGFIQACPLEIDDERHNRQRYTYHAQPEPTVHKIRVCA